jgi:cbb3-type cytochrome oxidase maturation protein
MNILVMTLPISVLLATLFVVFFIKAVRSDQFDDLETPAHIALLDEIENENIKKENKHERNQEKPL